MDVKFKGKRFPNSDAELVEIGNKFYARNNLNITEEFSISKRN